MPPTLFRQVAGLFAAGMVIGTTALLALPSVAPVTPRPNPPPMAAVSTQSCGEEAANTAECRSILEARRQRHDDWVAAIDDGGDDKDGSDSSGPRGEATDKAAAPSPAANVAHDAGAPPAPAQKAADAKRSAAAKRRTDRERAREAREARAQAEQHEWSRPRPSRARRPDARRFERRFEPYDNF